MKIPSKPDMGRLEFLKLELKTQEDEYKAYMLLPEDERMAMLMHERLCRENHTDMCSWGYEETWVSYIKSKYLGAARKAISAGVTYEQVEALIEAFKGV